MPGPIRSAGRAATALVQLLLLGTALLGLRSPLEIVLGVIVVGLLINTTN